MTVDNCLRFIRPAQADENTHRLKHIELNVKNGNKRKLIYEKEIVNFFSEYEAIG